VIFVTVPNFDGYIRRELASWMQTIPYKVHFSTGRPVEEAMNKAVNVFLETDCKFLLNIDSDNVPVTDIFKMAEHNKDICFAPYPIWQNVGGFPAKWGMLVDTPSHSGLQEIEACAAGSMMVARRVLEEMSHPIFERKWGSDGEVERGVDYYFCDKARKLGFKVFADWNQRSKHWQELELTEVIVAHQKSEEYTS
jgi:hypothetical protein